MLIRVLIMAALAASVGACGDTAAQKKSAQIQAALRDKDPQAIACFQNANTIPDARLIGRYFPVGEPSPQMQANSALATPDEARAVFNLRTAYVPCRKLRLEVTKVLGDGHTYAWLHEYQNEDAMFRAVATGQMTWGQFSRSWFEKTERRKVQVATADNQLQTKLTADHSNALQKREAATNAVVGVLGAVAAGAAVAAQGYQMQQQQQQIQAQQQLNAGPTLVQPTTIVVNQPAPQPQWQNPPPPRPVDTAPRYVNCTRIANIVDCKAY